MAELSWIDLAQTAMAHRDQLARRIEEIPLAMIAGENITIFGRRAEVSISWPDGLPMGMSAEELKDYAAELLTVLRDAR